MTRWPNRDRDESVDSATTMISRSASNRQILTRSQPSTCRTCCTVVSKIVCRLRDERIWVAKSASNFSRCTLVLRAAVRVSTCCSISRLRFASSATFSASRRTTFSSHFWTSLYSSSGLRACSKLIWVTIPSNSPCSPVTANRQIDRCSMICCTVKSDSSGLTLKIGVLITASARQVSSFKPKA